MNKPIESSLPSFFLIHLQVGIYQGRNIIIFISNFFRKASTLIYRCLNHEHSLADYFDHATSNPAENVWYLFIWKFFYAIL